MATEREDQALADTEDVVDELQQLLEQVGDRGRFKLYRIEGGEAAYVCSGEPGAFSEDWVRDEHGGGKYELRIRGPGGEVRGSKRFTVVGPPKIPAAAAPAAAVPAPAVSDALLQELRDLRRAIASPPAAQPTGNPMEIAAAMMGSMVPIVTTLMEAVKPARGSSGPSMGEMMELFQQGLELGKAMSGEGGGVAAALSPMIAPLSEILKQQAATGGAPRAAALPAGPNPGAPAVPVSPLVALRPFIGKLLQKAAAGSDPGLYADVIADEYPPAVEWVTDQVEQRGADSVLAEFTTLYPPTGQYSDWFRQLLQGLVADPEPDETENGEGDS